MICQRQKKGADSSSMRARVTEAINRQRMRYKDEGILFNSQLKDQDFQNIVILTSKKKNFFVRHLSQWVLVFVQEIGFCVSQEQLPILREVSRLKKHIWQRR